MALFKKEEEYSILDRVKGAGLAGKKYQPLFPYFQHFRPGSLQSPKVRDNFLGCFCFSV